MVHLEVSAHIPLPIEEYWRLRITSEFLATESKILKNASKTISKTEHDDEGRVIYHQMKTKPDLSAVPSVLMAMLPEEGIVYVDDIEYVTDDEQTPYVCRTRTTPNIAQDSCNITSYMRVIQDPADANACIQTLTLDVSVSLWMAGSAVESLIANGVRDGYKKLPQIVQTYLATLHVTDERSSTPLSVGSVSSLADSDYYGSVGELNVSDGELALAAGKHGLKREHSAPNDRLKQTTSGLRGMLLGGGKKRFHIMAASTGSLDTQ